MENERDEKSVKRGIMIYISVLGILFALLSSCSSGIRNISYGIGTGKWKQSISIVWESGEYVSSPCGIYRAKRYSLIYYPGEISGSGLTVFDAKQLRISELRGSGDVEITATNGNVKINMDSRTVEIELSVLDSAGNEVPFYANGIVRGDRIVIYNSSGGYYDEKS